MKKALIWIMLCAYFSAQTGSLGIIIHDVMAHEFWEAEHLASSHHKHHHHHLQEEIHHFNEQADQNTAEKETTPKHQDEQNLYDCWNDRVEVRFFLPDRKYILQQHKALPFVVIPPIEHPPSI